MGRIGRAGKSGFRLLWFVAGDRDPSVRVRGADSVTGLDFSGLDFSGLDFSGLDFSGLDFSGLDFSGLDVC
jgi:hypothetical protein